MITTLRLLSVLAGVVAVIILAIGEWLAAQSLTSRGEDAVHWSQVTGLVLLSAIPLMLWVAASWDTP